MKSGTGSDVPASASKNADALAAVMCVFLVAAVLVSGEDSASGTLLRRPFLKQDSSVIASTIQAMDPDDFCPDTSCEVNCQFFTNGVFNTEQMSPTASLSSTMLMAALSFFSYPENLLGAGVEVTTQSSSSRGLKYSKQFEDEFSSLFKRMGLSNYSFIDMRSIKGYETEGVIAASATDLILIFKGTTSVKDLIPDLSAKCTRTHAFGDLVCVHHGFLDAFLNSYNSIQATVQELLTTIPPAPVPAGQQGLRIWLTGHSLGAAIATLVAAGLAYDGYTVSGVTTFGSPRIGDVKFHTVYRQLGLEDNTYRWEHENDIVPQLPLTVMGYRHVGLRYIAHRGQCKYVDNDACVEAGLIPGFCQQSAADHYMQGYSDSIKHCLREEASLVECAIDNLPL